MSVIARFRLWLWIGGAVVVAVGLLLAAASLPWSPAALRTEVIRSLSERLDGEVDLAALSLRVFPTVHIEGSGLLIRHRGRRDVPPLVSVQSLVVDATVPGLLRKHVKQVDLVGLQINIPPRRASGEDEGRSDPQAENAAVKEFTIDRLISNDARLSILPSEPAKSPKNWMIHSLAMRSVAAGQSMPFSAALTNAVPPGEIDTTGTFGPWQPGDPGRTPLGGSFSFANADLGVFKGISGILSARGEFGGTLGRLLVQGETDTPQFMVKIGGHPMPLHLTYRATVDGTNGDTVLDQIDGGFLNTSLVAKGRVTDSAGGRGRTVTLDVVMDRARLEDVLRLAVKTPHAPMTGALTLRTTMVIPPGDRDVVERLRLDGQFSIATAKFTSLDIQGKVNELSLRSRGRTVDEKKESVASNLHGHFKLDEATLGLRGLGFETPGAQVRLDGTYQLRSERLDFKGVLAMEAKISETQRGIKRLLLKAIDPFFSGEHGGSLIPIKIEGTRNEPSFGLDKGRLFRRGG